MPKRGDKFPHFITNIDDQSRRQLPAPAAPGLHNPIFFVFAEKGPINVPTKGSYAFLQEVFGPMTFATKSKYFQHPNLFARTAAQYQEIWIVRLADDTAVTGSLLFEVAVKETDVVQYQKDVNGARVLDEFGDPVPELEIDGITPVTEPGLELTWAARALDYGNDETLTNIQPVVTMDGADTVTT